MRRRARWSTLLTSCALIALSIASPTFSAPTSASAPALASAAAAADATPAIHAAASTDHTTNTAAPAGHGAPVTPTPVPIQSIAELESDFSHGRTTVRAVTENYIARIGAIDTSGPSLHAVLEVSSEATHTASDLDAKHGKHGPLFGVPILLKDNIDTADTLLTTAGSLALTTSKPERDAFIVRRLRAAGAIILGKTNLSEWANGRSTRSSSGWSARGGQTRNPYALNRNPCGSSSGSGAGIAAGLAIVAIGTETDGSIVCPSSVNGLVGIKPTVGLVSRSGIIPIAASQDTAGPMAHSVADAAAVLTVLAGFDPDDPATKPMRKRASIDYTRFLNSDSLQGVRIGVMRHYAGFHEKVDAVFEQALAALRARGAVLVDPVEIPNADKLDKDEEVVLQYEFKDGINRYLRTRKGGGPRTLTDLIQYNVDHTTAEMPFFQQETFLLANARGPLNDPVYVEAHERYKRLAGPEGIDAALAKDHLDVLIAPTVGPAWVTDLVNGDHFLGGNVSIAPAVAGYPHITVPMGAVEGLPVGLSFVGAAWSEAKLISYAFAYEDATHAAHPPEFREWVP